MRAHLLAPFGIAGDLFLGTLVDTGAPLAVMQQAVDATGVGPVRLDAERVRVNGVTATRVTVTVGASARRVATWQDASSVLDGADFDPAVREQARAVYRALAQAEAAVHGTTVESVHFHELGDPDTVADIVAAVAGLDALGVHDLTCGPVAVGGGTVTSDHGILPVPAPAVLALLDGFEVVGGPAHHTELTTPTGAALLAALARPVPGVPAMRLAGHGRGAGDPGREPTSVLTLLLGTATAEPAAVAATILEATVDDLDPRLVPVVLDRLRDAGAHDAWATPVLMKKGRPGYTLTALADPDQIDRLTDVFFVETTTIGLRWTPVNKLALDRYPAVVRVDGHDIRVKIAQRAGQIVSAEPEFDDIVAAATASGVPVIEMLARAKAVALDHFPPNGPVEGPRSRAK